MNFYDLIKHRKSVRRFEDRSIPRDVLDRIIDAARLAPSAVNAQPWRFIVVDDPKKKKDVADALTLGNMNKYAYEAGAIIVIVEEPVNFASKVGGWLKGKHYAHMDLGIAAEHIALAATEEGLGSCIVGWTNENAIRKSLNIPSRKRVPLVVTVGYCDMSEKPKIRKPIDEVRGFNSY